MDMEDNDLQNLNKTPNSLMAKGGLMSSTSMISQKVMSNVPMTSIAVFHSAPAWMEL